MQRSLPRRTTGASGGGLAGGWREGRTRHVRGLGSAHSSPSCLRGFADRDRRVHPEEDRHRDRREQEVADHVDRPVRAVLGVLDIVAEDAERFAGRPIERSRSGSAEHLHQHVALQHARDPEAKADIDDPAELGLQALLNCPSGRSECPR